MTRRLVPSRRLSALLLPLALSGTAVVLPSSNALASDSLVPSSTSWIANSAHGGGYNDPNARWVQQDVEGAAVDTDGTVYAATYWEEGTSHVGVYRDGKVVGRLKDTGGWGRFGGSAVAIDSRHVYQAMQQAPQSGIDSPSSGRWYGFRRFDKVTLQYASLPANGRSAGASMRVVGTTHPVTGLASTGAEVFAAVAGEGRVRVYRTSDYAEVRSFAVPSPTQIALTRTGSLWVISGTEVREYDVNGTHRRTLTGVVKPTAVAVDGRGRLLVTSDGPRQQVLVYDVSGTPVEVDAIGVAGGMFAAPRGAAGPLRFNGPVGVGADSAGNVYVANGLGGDGTDLRKLTPSAAGWTEQWQLLGLAFVDNADLSPVDDTVVYTSRDRFQLDLSRPPGQQWVWKAHTVDRMAHPDDSRNKDNHQYVTPDAVKLGGKTFLFQTGMYQAAPRFYRFEGEIAVPSTVFANSHGWGWQVDAGGDVWNADGIRLIRHRFLGLDAAGNPTFAAPEVTSMPPGFRSLQRVRYDRTTDTMFLAGWTDANPRPSGNDLEKLVGKEIWRIDKWSTGNRAATWKRVLPFSRIGTDIRTLYGQIGLSFAGERFFTVEMGTSKVRSYSTATGEQLSEWLPGAEVGNFVGVVDVPDGIKAAQRSDGTYVIFVEEDHAAKVLMYTVPGKVTPDASLPGTGTAPVQPPTAPTPTPSPVAPSPTVPPSPLPAPEPTEPEDALSRYRAAVQADSPVTVYGFEDDQAQAAPTGGSKTSGAMSGSRAWSVTGADQVLAGKPATPIGTSWSLESWVKVDATSKPGSRLWSTPGANWWGLIRTYTVGTTGQSGPLFSAYGAPTTAGGSAREHIATGVTGAWHHVVVVAGPSTSRLYVDGRMVSERANTAVTLPGWVIGSAGGSGFRGALDEVAVYAKGLTSDDVAQHYAAAKAPVSDGPSAAPAPPAPAPAPAPASAYHSAIKADGPIAHYTFEDGADQGLPAGAVRTAGATREGKAWVVSGPGQTLADRPALPTGSSWTLETWVKVDPRASAGSAFWSTPGANWWGLLRTYRAGAAGQSTALLSSYGGPRSAAGHATEMIAQGTVGAWQHVVVTVTPTASRLYVNGLPAGQAANVSAALPAWSIGSPGGSGFVGAIDEVAVYAKPLSPEQVARHFKAASS